MSEILGAVPAYFGKDTIHARRIAEYVAANPEPVIPVREVIQRNTTNGRGFFYDTGGDGFAARRWGGIEDSLTLTMTLGLMEMHDRREQGTLDDRFTGEVMQEVCIAGMVHENVDIRSKDHSQWLSPIAEVIEESVTDCRGYVSIGRERVGSIEDSLALEEQLGRMDIRRRVVVCMSTVKNWSVVNLLAQLFDCNFDTTPKEKRPSILVAGSDIKGTLTKAVSGNINDHFGPIIEYRGKYPTILRGTILR